MNSFQQFRISKLTVLQALGVVGFLILISLLYALFFSYTHPTVNQVSYSNNNSNVFNLSIPVKLNFCGEDIPTNDYRIKGILEKEFMQNQYSRSSTHLLFNKAQRWFGYIEAVLKQEGIPDDFKYLAVIESHLSNVHSSAGAAGFWQLITNSAINGGLTVNATVDERLNVEKATRTACGLIKQAHMVFKNWTLSAAAYNRGINGILRAMKKQGTRDYHQLLLNPETGTFVYRILAYKTLLSNPRHFGINTKQIRTLPKIPYKIFRVDSNIGNLSDFARHIGVSYSTLKGHNPWLIADKLDNPTGILFEIKVPKNSKTDYSNYLSDLHPLVNFASDTLRALKDSTVLKTPENTVYVDTQIRLEDLAKQFHVSSNDLIKWNRLDPKTNTLEKQHVIVIDPAEIK